MAGGVSDRCRHCGSPCEAEACGECALTHEPLGFNGAYASDDASTGVAVWREPSPHYRLFNPLRRQKHEPPSTEPG